MSAGVATTSGADNEVACYETLAGASRAASRLVELGYDEDEILIAPHGFRVADEHPLRGRLRRGARLGTVCGASALGIMSLISVAGFDAIVTAVVPAIMIGAVVGLAVALPVAAARHRQLRTRAFGRPPEELAPERFGIVVAREAARARHQLARWWNPSAPPARRPSPS